MKRLLCRKFQYRFCSINLSFQKKIRTNVVVHLLEYSKLSYRKLLKFGCVYKFLEILNVWSQLEAFKCNGKMKQSGSSQFWVEQWYFRLSSAIWWWKKFCVPCKCCTNLKISIRHNDARVSTISPFDSKSRTLSNCIIGSTVPLCFHFTNMISEISSKIFWTITSKFYNPSLNQGHQRRHWVSAWGCLSVVSQDGQNTFRSYQPNVLLVDSSTPDHFRPRRVIMEFAKNRALFAKSFLLNFGPVKTNQAGYSDVY